MKITPNTPARLVQSFVQTMLNDHRFPGPRPFTLFHAEKLIVTLLTDYRHSGWQDWCDTDEVPLRRLALAEMQPEPCWCCHDDQPEDSGIRTILAISPDLRHVGAMRGRRSAPSHAT